MKKIALVLGSLIILTILGQGVFAEEHFCKFSEPVDLEYLFDDGTILAICLEADAFAIEVFLTTEEDGVLTMTIPRNVLDVRNPDCTDKIYQVFGDIGEPKVFETNTTTDSRTIEIHYNSQEVREFLVITTDVGIGKGYKLGNECSEESFGDELDLDYGEYVSPGNVWVEITHSAANPPPWSKWSGQYLKKYYPEEYKKISDEFDLIQKFYGQYDITILDVIKSQKNAQVCEAVGCLFGTYHLLIPEEGSEKFQNIDFKQMVFKTIPSPKKQIKIGINPNDVTCNEGLELIFKSTDGSPACVKPKTAEKLIERGWADSQYRILPTKINTDEIEKIWMEFFPVSCLAFDCSDDFLMGKSIEPKNNFNINLFTGFKKFDENGWDNRIQINSTLINDNFMKKYNIQIFDVKFYPTKQSVCEWGECVDQYSLYLQVSESDVNKMRELDFIISTEDALNYVDTTRFWNFIPVEAYTCGDVDCKFVNGDSNCPSTLRGYLIKENNELVTPQERFILELVEIDYSQCLM